MRKMERILFASDVESLYMPELWPFLAQRFGIEEFSMTTREVPDFALLMERRVAAIKRYEISFAMIANELGKLTLYPYAKEVMLSLIQNEHLKTIFISGASGEMLEPIFGPEIAKHMITNKLIVKDGKVEGFKFLISNDKSGIIAKEKVGCAYAVAIGDSANDKGMIQEADIKMLFNPAEDMRRAFPEAKVFTDLREMALSVMLAAEELH